MKTKTKPKVCADCGETWRRDPSPMVIDETWRAIGCEPQTMLCDMCLSSNYGWLRPGAPGRHRPAFDSPHRSVAQIGAVKVGRAQTIGRPHLWRLPDRIDTEGKIVVASNPEAIAAFIKSHAPYVVRIGLETGATSRSIAGKAVPAGTMAVVRSPDFLRALNQRDRACNIDPPTSSYAIMRRASPYRGENSGPGKDDRGEDTETRN